MIVVESKRILPVSASTDEGRVEPDLLEAIRVEGWHQVYLRVVHQEVHGL